MGFKVKCIKCNQEQELKNEYLLGLKEINFSITVGYEGSAELEIECTNPKCNQFISESNGL